MFKYRSSIVIRWLLIDRCEFCKCFWILKENDKLLQVDYDINCIFNLNLMSNSFYWNIVKSEVLD